MTDLLDAVDALTLERKMPAPPRSNRAGIVCLGEVIVQESLLDWLEAAVAGGIGIGGSSALASQRNQIDSDALYKFVQITSAIKSWALIAKSEIVKGDAGSTLRKWFVAKQASEYDETNESFYAKQLWSWVRQIEAKIDPPRIIDLPDDCPVCGAKSWWSSATREEYARPLVLHYREGNTPETTEALCRACSTVWNARELAYAIEQATDIDTKEIGA